MSVACCMARHAVVRGTHSDNVLLLLSVLGAFDALYAASFLLDAAVWLRAQLRAALRPLAGGLGPRGRAPLPLGDH